MKKTRDDHLTVSVDTITMLKAVAIVITAFLALMFLDAISKALILILVALFLALALNPAVSWIAKRLKSKSRARATGAAYLFVLAFLVAFFWLVLPPLVKQTVDFIQDVPRTIQEFKTSDTAASRFFYRYNLDEEVDRFSADFGNRFSDLGQPVLATAGAVGTAVVSLLTVVVLTFMMLVEGPNWLDKLLAIQPKSKREKRRLVVRKIYRAVTGYVNGQLILSLLAGVATFVALMIASRVFDVQINEVALAAIVSLFALLPLIGTTIGASIVILATLFVSTPLAITMAVFFIVYQQIENVTIQPYIQARTSKLTPLIVFSAALIGVTFGGILGALVAIPTAASIKILLEEHYRNRLQNAEQV